MRSEQQMYDLILKVAKEDENVRAVYIGGSRANPNVPKDMFQDFDVVFVVKDVKPFVESKEWIKKFGDILILQDSYLQLDSDRNTWNKSYTYLMQFMDGNRIDLGVFTKERMLEQYNEDKMDLPLLDKDGILPKIPAPTDIEFHVKKPSQYLFDVVCNEFWWVSVYIAKGLWREELLYALSCLNFYVRPQFLKMMSWKVGIETNFSLSVGKAYKYLPKYLTEEETKLVYNSYPKADEKSIWDSVFSMTKLFDETARSVSEKLGLTYNEKEAKNVLDYLNDIYKLPHDAKEIR